MKSVRGATGTTCGKLSIVDGIFEFVAALAFLLVSFSANTTFY